MGAVPRIGYSFGYNKLEGPNEYLTPREAVRLLVDVVSRGGNLLLNVGPKADGTLPLLQRDVLEGLAIWMAVGSEAIHGSRPVENAQRYRSDDPWIRWTATADSVFAVVDAEADQWLEIPDIPLEADPTSGLSRGDTLVRVTRRGVSVLRHPGANGPRPFVLRFARHTGT